MAKKKYDLIFTEEEKQKIRQEYIDGSSWRDLAKKYDMHSSTWVFKTLLSGVTRNISESLKNAHKNHPEAFRHTEETKQKIREARLIFMEKHPEETAWRKRNEPSYPEKCFIKFLENNGYDKRFLIEREFPVFPYYIDFAFVNEKIAIEIDGSQHILDNERLSRDAKKDNLLLNKGWKVLRVSENLVKTDWSKIKETLDTILNGEQIPITKVGIFTHNSSYHYDKVKKDKYGRSEKMKDSFLKQRKVKNRPSYEQLKKEIEASSMVAVGKKYGVSDNAVRKWIKQYQKD